MQLSRLIKLYLNYKLKEILVSGKTKNKIVLINIKLLEDFY